LILLSVEIWVKELAIIVAGVAVGKIGTKAAL
jgi:hypothetical protein